MCGQQTATSRRQTCTRGILQQLDKIRNTALSRYLNFVTLFGICVFLQHSGERTRSGYYSLPCGRSCTGDREHCSMKGRAMLFFICIQQQKRCKRKYSKQRVKYKKTIFRLFKLYFNCQLYKIHSGPKCFEIFILNYVFQ